MRRHVVLLLQARALFVTVFVAMNIATCTVHAAPEKGKPARAA